MSIFGPRSDGEATKPQGPYGQRLVVDATKDAWSLDMVKLARYERLEKGKDIMGAGMWIY